MVEPGVGDPRAGIGLRARDVRSGVGGSVTAGTLAETAPFRSAVNYPVHGASAPDTGLTFGVNWFSIRPTILGRVESLISGFEAEEPVVPETNAR